MLKHLSLIALGFGLLIGGVTMAMFDDGSGADGRQGSMAPVILPNLTPTEQHGKGLFHQHCAQCHGINAIGSDKGPPFLHRAYHPNHHADGAFLLAVRIGVRRHHWSFGNMPPQPQVSDSDTRAIVTFVRALQRANGFAP